MIKNLLLLFVLVPALFSCNQGTKKSEKKEVEKDTISMEDQDIQNRLNQYVEVELTTDLSKMSDTQLMIIHKLIDAADLMNEVFWKEAFGNKNELLDSLDSEAKIELAKINYGPWDRLKGNEPFIKSYGPKPLGANFYPPDITKEEFENASLPNKKSLYTIIRRNARGELTSEWYHEAFSEQHKKAAKLLREASALTKNEGFKRYLRLRADALETDDYQESDLAWLDMKTNQIDVVIGPIETYEDQLFGYKASHEAYVLVKDMDWSKKLDKYAQFLPKLQKNLPVDPEYKQENPGTDAELNAYDVIYYAGDCNAGSKTIAINLPNDEEVQLEKGTRRLQLKNAMRAKFDKILVPIANVLIDEDQRSHVTFDAFFANTMFHEVAHGLGIKNTITAKGTVRKALQDQASALEEGKADILGLYMIKELHDWGELEGNLEDYYVTFMASIFRSVRFGASSAHGKANMLRFNYFKEHNAFTRQSDGTYKINFEEFEKAVKSLSNKILVLQGDGDYEGVKSLMEEKGVIGPVLQEDLDKLKEKGIPVDVKFKQGLDVLGITI